MGRFKATHEITVVHSKRVHGLVVNGRTDRIRVMFCGDDSGGGPAYTCGEWDAETKADWERSADGTWTFQGRPHPGVGTVEVRKL